MERSPASKPSDSAEGPCDCSRPHCTMRQLDLCHLAPPCSAAEAGTSSDRGVTPGGDAEKTLFPDAGWRELAEDTVEALKGVSLTPRDFLQDSLTERDDNERSVCSEGVSGSQVRSTAPTAPLLLRARHDQGSHVRARRCQRVHQASTRHDVLTQESTRREITSSAFGAALKQLCARKAQPGSADLAVLSFQCRRSVPGASVPCDRRRQDLHPQVLAARMQRSPVPS